MGPKLLPVFFRYSAGAAWLVSLAVSIGFSIHFGMELVRFGDGDRPTSPFTGELRISLIDWIGYYPMVIADQKGFLDRNLKSHGVQVELYKAADTGEMNDLIRTGKVQGTFGVLADFVVLTSLATPVRLVMTTDYSKSDVIVARKGIRAPKDLIGKRIGVPELNSFVEYFSIRSLEKAGVDKHLVSFRTVPAMEIPEAIQAGRIDAGYTWEPALSRARSYGMNEVITSAEQPEMVISGLILRDEVLVNPALPAAIIRSYFEGYDFLIKNPTEGASTIAKFFGIKPEDVIRILKTDAVFVDLANNLKAFEADGVIQKEIKSINHFFGERGSRQTDLSVLQLLDKAPLHEVLRTTSSVSK